MSSPKSFRAFTSDKLIHLVIGAPVLLDRKLFGTEARASFPFGDFINAFGELHVPCRNSLRLGHGKVVPGGNVAHDSYEILGGGGAVLELHRGEVIASRLLRSAEALVQLAPFRVGSVLRDVGDLVMRHPSDLADFLLREAMVRNQLAGHRDRIEIEQTAIGRVTDQLFGKPVVPRLGRRCSRRVIHVALLS